MPRSAEDELLLLLEEELRGRRPRRADNSPTNREHRAAAVARRSAPQYRSRSAQPIGRSNPPGRDGGYIHC